jgi:hypothetical protein
MKKSAYLFMFLGMLAGIIGFVNRFFDLALPVSPDGWVSITGMLLLFSIALSLLAISKR